MLDLGSESSVLVAAVFLASAGAIGLSGVRLAHAAEAIAVKTGIGQAIIGAVFLGISTSLSGSVLTLYAASQDRAALVISNSIGGIAAQTAFLVIADFFHRKANLEHAASSLENLLQVTLLMMLLVMPLLALAGPQWLIGGVHPASVLILLLYILGLHIVRSTTDNPLWSATHTLETQKENESTQLPGKLAELSLPGLLLQFSILALILGFSGISLSETAIEISQRSGLSETAVGGLLTSIATSLPELITMLTAVQRGALNLAMGDIVGGNTFDVLFLTGADVFYQAGSIYHAIQTEHVFMIGSALLMNGFLLLGLLRRQKHGPANIGFEGVAIVVVYIVLVAYLLTL